MKQGPLSRGAAPRRAGRRIDMLGADLVRPVTTSRRFRRLRSRLVRALARFERCRVCGQRTVEIRKTRDRSKVGRTMTKPLVLDVRRCSNCGHVGNPDNFTDYRAFASLEHLPMRARIGTPERPGREFHMAQMALEILGRPDADVLIFGAGRSFDNLHVARLPGVRRVAVGDVMRLRPEDDFVDINRPATESFDIVVASEVIEHFLEPRRDFAQLFGYVAPDGLLVCGTNVNTGGDLSKQHYLFLGGHTSYYSATSLSRLAAASGFLIDFRIPLVATGYGGPRKRYVLFTRSPEVKARIDAYFETHEYAPSEGPWANLELQAATGAAAGAVAVDDSDVSAD